MPQDPTQDVQLAEALKRLEGPPPTPETRVEKEPENLAEYLTTFPAQIGKGFKTLITGTVQLANYMILGAQEWLTDPVETLNALFDPERGGQVASSIGSAIVDDFKTRYRPLVDEGPQAIGKIIWRDPVSFVLDVTTIFDAAGLGAKAVGSTANFFGNSSNKASMILARAETGLRTVGDKWISVGGTIQRMPWTAVSNVAKMPFSVLMSRYDWANRVGSFLGVTPEARSIERGFERLLAEGRQIAGEKIRQAALTTGKLKPERAMILDQIIRGARPVGEVADEFEAAYVTLWKRVLDETEQRWVTNGVFDRKTFLRNKYSPAVVLNQELRDRLVKASAIPENVENLGKYLKDLDGVGWDALAPIIEREGEILGLAPRYKPLVYMHNKGFSEWMDDVTNALVESNRGKVQLHQPGKTPFFQKKRLKTLEEALSAQWVDPLGTFSTYVIAAEHFRSMGKGLKSVILDAGGRRWMPGMALSPRERLVPMGIYEKLYGEMADRSMDIGQAMSAATEKIVRERWVDKTMIANELTRAARAGQDRLAGFLKDFEGVVKTNQWMAVPEGAALALERMVAPVSGVFHRMFRGINSWYKPLMLTFGGGAKYALGNTLGNIHLAAIAGVTPGAFAMWSSGALRKWIPASVRAETVPSEVAAKLVPRIGGLAGALIRPVVGVRNLATKFVQLVNKPDGMFRSMTFLTELEKEAAKRGLTETGRAGFGLQERIEALASVLDDARLAQEAKNLQAQRIFELPEKEAQLAKLVELKTLRTELEAARNTARAERPAAKTTAAGAPAKLESESQLAALKAKVDALKAELLDPSGEIGGLKKRLAKKPTAGKAPAKEAAQPLAGRAEAVQAQINTLEKELARLEKILDDPAEFMATLEREIAEIKAFKPEAKHLKALEATEKAAREAERFFFNYQTSLTHFERKWMREVMPFYTFMRNMFVLVGQLPFIRPKSLFAWDRLADFSVDLYNDLGKPEKLRDYIPIGVDADTGIQLWAYMPTTNPLMSGLIGDTELGKSLFPMITATIETVAGRDVWGYPITDLKNVTGFNGRVYEYSAANGTLRRKPPLGFNHLPLWASRMLNNFFPRYRMIDRIINGYDIKARADAEADEATVGPRVPFWAQSLIRAVNFNMVPETTMRGIEAREKAELRFITGRQIPEMIQKTMRDRRLDADEKAARIRWFRELRRGLASGKYSFVEDKLD